MTITENDRDLPVPLKDFLPVPLPDLGPQPKQAESRWEGWHNWAHQRHVRGLTYGGFHDDLWLATAGGVLRWYPGYEQFTRYTSEHGLPGNSITAIAADGSGRIYCAPAYGGLYRFKDDAWRLVGGEAYQTLPIRCLTTDSNGRVWIGALDGIYQVDSRGGITCQFEFPSVEAARSIAVTDQGDVWACYSLGLFRFNQSGIHQAGKQPTLLNLACSGNTLWVGKLDGLVKIDMQANRPSQEAQWPKGTITALMPASEGLYLVCDHTFGRVSGAAWQPLLDNIQGHCGQLAPDDREGVWLATHQGLLRWSESETQSFLETQKAPDHVKRSDFSEPNTYFGNIIQSLAIEQKNGRSVIWAATQEGLFKYSSEEHALADFLFYAVDGMRDIQAITTGLEPGDIWLAGFAGGVYNYQQTGNLEKMTGLAAPVLSLSHGLDGTRWAVATDGLYCSRGAQWELILSATKLPAGLTLWCVAHTQADVLWMGTTAGLIKYDMTSDAIDIPTEHPFQRKILALAYDPAHAILWVGTETGLFGLQPRGDGWAMTAPYQFTATDSGLGSDRVIALALDDSETERLHLWIGTPCGLSRFQYERQT